MNYPANGFVTAYIGLGSNLASPTEQITTACQRISTTPDISLLVCSGLYHSEPMGPQNQPDYVNAVMAIRTTLAPLPLLHCLQTIEQQHGRTRTGERWGARTLDLDLLIYGEQQIDLPELTIPHVGIGERAFVLLPLYEIAPQLIVPGYGTLTSLLDNCPLTNIKRLTP